MVLFVCEYDRNVPAREVYTMGFDKKKTRLGLVDGGGLLSEP